MRGVVFVCLIACGEAAPELAPSSPSPSPIAPALDAAPAIDHDAVIARQWPDGCFLLRDARGAIHASDRVRCDQPRRPYSTFKIANALIALDAGVLAGASAPMTWDTRAIPDEPQFRDAWRKPHTLRSAMAVSSLPHFRTLARTLGEARMRAGLAKLDYGNRDMSGGLDRFWLPPGGLRISAAQQLALVEDLAHGRLAVSAQAQATVRDVIELAHTPDAVLRGKTGTGPIEDRKGGWLAWQVGWVERGATIVSYAAWMEVRGEKPSPTGGKPIALSVDAARAAREQRLRATLAELAVFPR